MPVFFSATRDLAVSARRPPRPPDQGIPGPHQPTPGGPGPQLTEPARAPPSRPEQRTPGSITRSAPPRTHGHDHTKARTCRSPALTFLAGLLAEDRAQRRTWRKLPPPEQALLVLVHLRKGERYEQLAEGFQVSVGTVHNYIREAVRLLATHGRTLLAAVWIFAWTQSNFLILDGTVVRTNRVRAHNKLYYSGKHKYHGINLQGLTDPYG
ncbi:transposase, partial [Frankia sp. CeD]|uniref:transposase n=1 Tax=Frankia sp. CeD TaxID=258230 RepID=UPI0004DD5FE1